MEKIYPHIARALYHLLIRHQVMALGGSKAASAMLGNTKPCVQSTFETQEEAISVYEHLADFLQVL